MFASRGGRQGSSFLRETVASLTVERRGRNWPRVGERPQASASFSFLQPSRWAIDYRSTVPSFSRTVLLGRSSPAPLRAPPAPNQPLPPTMSPLPLPPVDTTVVAVAAFSAVYAATLLVYAASLRRDVGGVHAIGPLSREKRKEKKE